MDQKQISKKNNTNNQSPLINNTSKDRGKTLGIIGLSFNITGIALGLTIFIRGQLAASDAFLILFGVIGFTLLGLIFSIIGYRRSKNTGYRNIVAIIGMGFNCVLIFLALYVMTGISNAISQIKYTF